MSLLNCYIRQHFKITQRVIINMFKKTGTDGDFKCTSIFFFFSEKKNVQRKAFFLSKAILRPRKQNTFKETWKLSKR